MPKICIDAGHGANDPGASNGSRLEKNDNLAIALMLKTKFLAQGWVTVLTRSDDTRITLAERTALANKENCDLFISCHRNSFSAETATGAEIWLHSKAPLKYIEWASGILEDLDTLGLKNRGVKLGYRDDTATDFSVNRDTTMPSMMLELGFITNSLDNMIFVNKMSEICDSIVKNSCKFLDVPYKTDLSNTPEQPAAKMYTLDVAKLKEQGFTKIVIAL